MTLILRNSKCELRADKDGIWDPQTPEEKELFMMASLEEILGPEELDRQEQATQR